MKLKPNHKVLFLTVGLISAWFALYIMFVDFYEGLVEVTVAVAKGGAYHPYYLWPESTRFGIWIFCIFLSSVCLAIGLRAEKLR